MEYQQSEGVTVKKTWLLRAREDSILVGYSNYGCSPFSPEVVLGRKGKGYMRRGNFQEILSRGSNGDLNRYRSSAHSTSNASAQAECGTKPMFTDIPYVRLRAHSQQNDDKTTKTRGEN